MSDKLDRQSLEVACDFLEEHGFAEQEAIFRKWVAEKCRPTIEEVLPLAMECFRRWPDSIYNFFGEGAIDDEGIRFWAGQSVAEEIVRLCGMLLQMTRKQRRRVARDARDAIERERTERNRPLNLEESPGVYHGLDGETTVSDSVSMSRYGRGMIDWGVSGFREIPPPADFTAHLEALRNSPGNRMEVDGETMEIAEYGEDPRVIGGRYIVGRTANGVLRRFSGLKVLAVRFKP